MVGGILSDGAGFFGGWRDLDSRGGQGAGKLDDPDLEAHAVGFRFHQALAQRGDLRFGGRVAEGWHGGFFR
jgi:hypothetical protein